MKTMAASCLVWPCACPSDTSYTLFTALSYLLCPSWTYHARFKWATPLVTVVDMSYTWWMHHVYDGCVRGILPVLPLLDISACCGHVLAVVDTSWLLCPPWTCLPVLEVIVSPCLPCTSWCQSCPPLARQACCACRGHIMPVVPAGDTSCLLGQ